jgi:uncharacterized protein YjbI with pentapeptide repeats
MGRITTRLDEEPLAVYRQLEHVSPEDRAEIVLNLITQYGILELPEQDGQRANLSGVDLSPHALKVCLDRLGTGTAPWWESQPQRAFLPKANLQRARLRNANLQDANLWMANLEGSDLEGANLQKTRLREANLRRADLWEANLQQANLFEANLREADLRYARLYDLDLLVCRDLTHIYIAGAYLERTRLRPEQLGWIVGEELLAQADQAQRILNAPPGIYRQISQTQLYEFTKHAYLALKQNFNDLGDYEAASWAYGKERLMEKMESWLAAQQAIKDRKWLPATRSFLKCASDQLVEWVCGYGESIGRVLATLILLLITSAALYGIFGAVVREDGTHLAFPIDMADLIVFSLNTMTNTDLGHLAPADDPLAHLAQGVQTLIAIFLTGLLGFVVGNRIRRS